MRVTDVSQSGLTHDCDFDFGSGLGLGFSMEDLMEKEVEKNLGFGEGRRVDFVVKRVEEEEEEY